MNDILSLSYSSANVFPAKLLKKNILDKEGRIKPVHVQLSPTNACNLNCSFCCCKNRDKNLELPVDYIAEVMLKGKQCGTEAVTITGGGEPLMHSRIEDIIIEIKSLGIDIGLTTNGTLVHIQSSSFWKNITYCRISCYGKWTEEFKKKLDIAVKHGDNVDWGFTFVVEKEVDYESIENMIKYANDNGFKYVKLVSNILEPENIERMKTIKENIHVDDSLVIYQDRIEYSKGFKRCLISLLKPFVATDGYLYPCCGTQYATKKMFLDFGNERMRMGKAKDIDKIYQEQKFFDGSVCERCYYKNYNDALEIIISNIKHEKFV